MYCIVSLFFLIFATCSHRKKSSIFAASSGQSTIHPGANVTHHCLMTLEYACIARGTTILVQCALASGNFDISALDVLAKMDINQTKASYDRSKIRFFVLRDEVGLNFLGATRNEISPTIAFSILEDVQRRFTMQFARNWRSAQSYGLQQEFSDQLKSMIQSSTNAKLSQIRSNINQTQETMTSNLEAAMLRGLTLDEMNDKADDIARSATEFERNASAVRRRMWWEKYRMYLFAALGLILIIYIIAAIACKGMAFQGCRSSSSSSGEEPSPTEETPVPPETSEPVETPIETGDEAIYLEEPGEAPQT